ncbi:MAG TPA: hypothetical protein VM925_34515 [Labilithrix sp.]|jgi:Tfp pilus assembly protein PilF|nr:hypothetical protein [Labilithrix sp.]
MNATTHTLDALYAVGHRLIGQERPRDALSLFRTMLLVDARDERGWLALATCHELLAEPDKALTLYRLASTACEGKAVRCAIARARLHRSLGANDEATDAYEEAARMAEALDDDDAAALVAREAGAA